MNAAVDTATTTAQAAGKQTTMNELKPAPANEGSLPAVNVGFTSLQSFQLLWRVSQMFASSSIVPERFRAINSGKQVFYVKDMTRAHTEANNIFFAEQGSGALEGTWKILWAEKGKTKVNPKTSQTELVLENGRIYEGKPGQSNYKIYQFGQLNSVIPMPQINVADDVRTLNNKKLLPWNNKNLEYVAELNWRISIPMMVFVLTLLALPLSKVNSRQGKYARLVPALLLYIIYANLMFLGRDWITKDIIPWWLGLWWLHSAFASIALSMMLWQRKYK